MAKFRKKPVVIDAVQWDGSMSNVPAGCVSLGTDNVICVTLEGEMHVSPNDWIITGVKGERYPCKPDIFAMTYEAVS